MTFLNPLFLWFLPLISVPIIIHLLAKRKSKMIDFPSLKFLKMLEQDALKKFNVKQLILLIIRTLMILLIILAFARPILNLRSSFGLQSGGVDLLVIALDNTASNRENIRALEGKWLEKFSSDLKARGFTVKYCGITDMQLVESLKAVEPQYSGIYSLDLNQALAEQLDMEQYSLKSILWIGDGQDAREALGEFEGWNQYLLSQPITQDNGISDLGLPSQGIRLGETYELRAAIDFYPDNLDATAIELLVNERRQNQSTIEPGNPEIKMNGRVEEEGYQSGQLALISDENSYNNKRHFVLPAGGAIPVQILRSAKNPDFWRLIEIAVEERALNLDIRLLDYNEIDNLNLSNGGTVIVDDASQLVLYNWNRLATFTRGGGQLILFGDGGENMGQLLNFKNSLQQENSPFPLGLFMASSKNRMVSTSPLNAAISQNRLQVFKRYNTFGDELDVTWIRYLDEQPFLGVNYLQNGRIIWFNTDFELTASNLPLLGIFPTLMLQLCQSQELKAQTDLYNHEVGDTLLFYPPVEESQNLPYSVQRPDGSMEYMTPDTNFVIRYSQTNLPGIYQLARGRKMYQPMAVNVSSHEARAHSRLYNVQDTGIFVNENKDVIQHEVLKQRSGLALWSILLILLLILWAIESYLSRIKSTWRQNV